MELASKSRNSLTLEEKTIMLKSDLEDTFADWLQHNKNDVIFTKDQHIEAMADGEYYEEFIQSLDNL